MRIRLILSFLLIVVARSNANGQAALPPTGPAETSFANISTRGLAENSADGLIVGFVVAGEGFQPVLLRAVGPGLTAFGVGGVMPDPILKLSGSQGVEVARNDNWQEDTTVATHAARLGAFPLEPEIRDAALLISLGPGAYTAIVSAAQPAASGIALAEVYECGDSVPVQEPADGYGAVATGGDDEITVSWCKFYYTSDLGHDYPNLIGASDTDTGLYRITMHHNWYSTLCKQRMPSCRFGNCHVYK